MLRLFFLSLLWRAAATTLPEFHAVQLPPEGLERLRKMLVTSDPEPSYFYPISLLQIVTRGPAHNLAPIAKDFGPLDMDSVPTLKTFRFYFDGLIVHVHCPPNVETFSKVPEHIVGYSTRLAVQTQTWEDSFQFANMKQHVLEGTLQWPDVIQKLTALRRSDIKHPGGEGVK